MKMPPISLENLTEEEKDVLASRAAKKLKTSLLIYAPLFLLGGYTVYYLNQHYMGLGIEDANLRSFLNVTLVLLTVLPARLMVGAVVQQRKALSAWQKKVYRSTIQSIQSGTVVIVNQKIKVSQEHLAEIKAGDEVELATNPSGEVLIYIRKV